MSKPTMTRTIELPGGVAPRDVLCTLRLVAIAPGDAFGEVTGTDHVSVGGVRRGTPNNAGLVTWTNVRPNSGSSADVITSPPGTYYEHTVVFPDGRKITDYFQAPDSAGTYNIQSYIYGSPTAPANGATTYVIKSSDSQTVGPVTKTARWLTVSNGITDPNDSSVNTTAPLVLIQGPYANAPTNTLKYAFWIAASGSAFLNTALTVGWPAGMDGITNFGNTTVVGDGTWPYMVGIKPDVNTSLSIFNNGGNDERAIRVINANGSAGTVWTIMAATGQQRQVYGAAADPMVSLFDPSSSFNTYPVTALRGDGLAFSFGNAAPDAQVTHGAFGGALRVDNMGAGNAYLYVGNTGTSKAGQIVLDRAANQASALFFTSAGTNEFWIGQTASNANNLYVQDTVNARQLAQFAQGAAGAAVMSVTDQLKVQAGSGQTNNVLTLNNSAGNQILGMTPGGTLAFGTAADVGLSWNFSGALRVAATGAATDYLYVGSTAASHGGVIVLDRPANQAIQLYFTSASTNEFWIGQAASDANHLYFNDAVNARTLMSFTQGTAGNALITFGDHVSMADPGNLVLGTTTGTKIGTATNQKLGFWNATPVVQPTTGVAAAAFVANAGTAVNDASTFGGYTLKQVVKALQTVGILA